MDRTTAQHEHSLLSLQVCRFLDFAFPGVGSYLLTTGEPASWRDATSFTGPRPGLPIMGIVS